jgi:hypothetical protein
MKSSELKQMIEEIVEQQVKKLLPQMLSEMYVRRVVAEQVGSTAAPARSAKPAAPAPAKRPTRSLIESLQNDIEETASSAYRIGAPQRDDGHDEARAKFGDAAHLFEGVRPMDDPGVSSTGAISPVTSNRQVSETEAKYGPGGVPLELLGIAGKDMGAVAQINQTRKAPDISDEDRMQFEEKRLAIRRRLLEAQNV